MNWYAPEVEVTLGDRVSIGDVARMEVIAGRSMPIATAFLNLSNQRFAWQDGAADGDPLIIRWGWRGQELQPLFDGTVQLSYLREDFNVVGLCRARALMDTHVTRTYQVEDASAIVANLVSAMPFIDNEIAICPQQIDKLPLHDSSIIEAIQYLNRRLDLDYAFWCDPTGGFHWSPRDYQQDPVATFANAEDVIDMRMAPGNRFLLQVMGSPLWHSQVIAIIDRDGSETRYFIEEVQHSIGINDQGARSNLLMVEVPHD